ncbi:hypothetical protein F53441_223 [Fusarium austroafricanum]|uniref:Uncharacterized protein n=1 Tax=Fusarium austroafricanum TaxID=2364996 RepID=A0A8H4P5E5_9HYPO|nr:hypothetical protein F53441_223 [Fusarium austroafricanum]
MSMASTPLKPKQKRRFYEPVVLYKALAEITHEVGALRRIDVPDNPRTEEQRYHRFLHRIASVCDRTKGGKTVTSVTILDGEETYSYVFACNQISGQDLHDTEGFLTALLTKLCGFQKLRKEKKDSTESDILKMILTFNSPRINIYLNGLRTKFITQCLEFFDRQTGTDNAVIVEGLRALEKTVEDTTFKGLNGNEYLESYNTLWSAFKAFRTPRATAFVDKHATNGRFNDGKSLECWSELRHSLSRLQNYKRVVKDLIEAEKEWPYLFQEFVVVPVESSTTDMNPLGRKSESSSNIIGRMCSNKTEKQRYCNLAQNLQNMHLDERIQYQCTKPTFKPYVHCEILVLEWVITKTKKMDESERSSDTFFNDWKYIGSSKPACQLCRYYFDSIGQHNNIKTRASHGNLYTSWRFPDLPESDDSFSQQRRQNIFNSMMEKIRHDAFEILVTRNSEGKKHDSSTHTLMSVRPMDLQTDLGARELPDVDELGEDFATGLSLDSPSNSLEESDRDDEEGGTSLG